MLHIQYNTITMRDDAALFLWHGSRYAGHAYRLMDGRWRVRLAPAGVQPVRDADLMDIPPVSSQADAALAMLCSASFIGADAVLSA